MKQFSLPKSERLCGDKVIQRLFAEGKSGFAHPFRYYWRTSEAEPDCATVTVLFSVPKKIFKRAVKRNLLKRRAREAYRLNKNAAVATAQDKGLKIELAIIYSSKELSDFKTIENGIRRLLAEITKRT